MPRFGFVPIEDDPFSGKSKTDPALAYAREIGGQNEFGRALGRGLARDVNDLFRSVEGVGEAFGTIGNALMGDAQVEIGANGEVSPIDPRLVDAAGTVSGLVAGPGSLMPRPRGSLGVFGGVNAKTADMDALATAMKLEREGVNEGNVWRATGWAKGPDGQWRFEIPDHTSKYDENALKPWSSEGNALAREIWEREGYREASPARRAEIDAMVEREIGAAAPLEDILTHNALYEAYPDLRSMRVERVEREDMGGYYDPITNHMAATPKGASVTHNRGAEGHSVMLHEVQHAIQTREGFAHGGSPQDPSVATAAQALVDKLAARRDELKAKIGQSPIVDESLLTEYASIVQTLGRMEKRDAGMVGYQTLAGEVEARNVESRFQNPLSSMHPPMVSEDVPRFAQWVRTPREWNKSGKGQAK